MAPEKRVRQSRNAAVIEQAVRAVQKKDMSIRQASKHFNIPFETLRRHASGEAKSTTLGRPPKFDKEMETELRETVKEMLNMGRGVGLEEVKELGMELCASTGLEPFKKEMPSRGWARGFMARNNLSLKSELTSSVHESCSTIQEMEHAVRSINYRGPALKEHFNPHSTLLETLGMQPDMNLHAQGTDIADELLYMGHVVGLVGAKDQAPELCSVELKECNEFGSEPHHTKKCGTEPSSSATKGSPYKITKRRGRRDSKEIERAIYAINYEKLSIRQASKHFCIPFETLRRHFIEESKKNSFSLLPTHVKKMEEDWKDPINKVMSLGHRNEVGLQHAQQLRKELSQSVFLGNLSQSVPPRDWAENAKAKSHPIFVVNCDSSRNHLSQSTEFKVELDPLEDPLKTEGNDK